jgi:predicted HTH domain antitoxin
MTTVQVNLPEELLRKTNVFADTFSPASASREVAKLLALELFREGVVPLGRAAEHCDVSRAEFMQFAADREVPLHSTLNDLKEDHKFIENLPSWS